MVSHGVIGTNYTVPSDFLSTSILLSGLESIFMWYCKYPHDSKHWPWTPYSV